MENIKTPDEIKELLEEIYYYDYNQGYNTKEDLIKAVFDKAFSLGVEEGYSKACEDIIDMIINSRKVLKDGQLFINEFKLRGEIRKLQEIQHE